MQPLNAFSLAPDSNDWLANSRQPRILHVFDQACNLINERREVLSIVTPQIGNGPFNLLIEDDILFSDYLGIDSSISIDSNRLHLGNLTVNTSDMELWSPHPDWKMLHAKRGDILRQIISLRGDCFGRKNTALAKTLAFTNYQPSLPISLLTTFSAAIANVDIPIALTTTHQLAGLGQGLTPAGDDFILGAVLAVWIIHPFEIASILAREITNTAAPLTTSLSAAWLRCAGRGEAAILWHNLFDAFISADAVQTQKAVDKILAVGETSGADALSGFVGMFMSWKAYSSKSVPGNDTILSQLINQSYDN